MTFSLSSWPLRFSYISLRSYYTPVMPLVIFRSSPEFSGLYSHSLCSVLMPSYCRSLPYSLTASHTVFSSSASSQWCTGGVALIKDSNPWFPLPSQCFSHSQGFTLFTISRPYFMPVPPMRFPFRVYLHLQIGLPSRVSFPLEVSALVFCIISDISRFG
jgi:hypothetical protein